jgi:hypothetical protein
MTCYKKDYLKRQKKQAFDSPLLDYYEVDSNTTPEQVFMFSMILTTSIARYKLIAHLIRQSDPMKLLACYTEQKKKFLGNLTLLRSFMVTWS